MTGCRYSRTYEIRKTWVLASGFYLNQKGMLCPLSSVTLRFFKLENAVILVGIVALVLVSVQSHSTYGHGEVIDAITRGQLTYRTFFLTYFICCLRPLNVQSGAIRRMYILGLLPSGADYGLVV